VTLARRVRLAAAAADSEDAFFAGLAGEGVMLRRRQSQRDPGEVTGYAVALLGDRTADGAPVWYGGGRLAADLTLPQLRRRWTTPAGEDADAVARDAAARTRILTDTAGAARTAAEQLRHPAAGEDPDALAHAVGDLAAAGARVVDGSLRTGRLTAAAADVARAAATPYARTPRPTPAAAALRSSARALRTLGRVAAGERDDLVLLMLHALADLLDAVAELRAAQDRLAQAAEARAAAELVRAHLAATVRPRRPAPTPAAHRARPHVPPPPPARGRGR
jgi:hypothetical protein